MNKSFRRFLVLEISAAFDIDRFIPIIELILSGFSWEAQVRKVGRERMESISGTEVQLSLMWWLFRQNFLQ